jgi:ribulose-5-phosphate 4-epimerase/fuculose-1-phosphate aldolase
MQGSEPREVKRKIQTAWRILRGENLLDFMGHVSARVSESTFLITPRMPKSGALGEDTLLSINSDGNVAKDKGAAPIELPLHQIIYKHRPDVWSVVHAHPTHAVALSASGRKFEVVHQLCLPFIEGVPVHEDFSMIDSADKAARMLKTLSSHRAMLLRNHGIVVTGSTVEEACVLTIWLEKCSEIQLAAGDLKIQGISKNEEALKLLDHQLRTTIGAAWNYYDSKHAQQR